MITLCFLITDINYYFLLYQLDKLLQANMWDEVRTLLMRLHKKKLEADADADVDHAKRLAHGGIGKASRAGGVKQHSQSSFHVDARSNRSKADATKTCSYHHHHRSSSGGGGKDGLLLEEVKVESAACRYICNRYDGGQRMVEVAIEHVVTMIEIVVSSGLKEGNSQLAVRAAADLAQQIGHKVYSDKSKVMLRRHKNAKLLRKGKWQVLVDNCHRKGLSCKKDLYHELIKVW
jgi:hypothetical protein